MGIVPDISISKRSPSATYYADFARRYGFADSAMRGVEASRVVVVAPVGGYAAHPTADVYAPDGRSGRSAASHDREIAAAKRAQSRANEMASLVTDLRKLHRHLLPRMSRRPSAAVRDAMIDVERILRGGNPVATGGNRIDVLRSLIRVLSRHA